MHSIVCGVQKNEQARPRMKRNAAATPGAALLPMRKQQQQQQTSERVAVTAASDPLASVRAGSASTRAVGNVAASAIVSAMQLVAQWLPACTLLIGAKALGYFVYYVVRYRRAVVARNVARTFPLASQAEQRSIARDSYVYASLTLMWFLRRQPTQTTLECAPQSITDLIELDARSDDALQAFETHVGAAQRNAIVLTGHIGMWELLPAALAQQQSEQWIVYRPLHQPALDAIVRKQREAPQRYLVPDKHCFAVLHNVLSTPPVSRAHVVGLVADQRASVASQHTNVSFLGQSTRWATGAARLLLAPPQLPPPPGHNYDTLLFVGALLHNRAFYSSNSNSNTVASIAKPFTLVLRQIDVPLASSKAPTSPSAQVDAVTQRYATELETLVRRDPAQYLWLHDLWRDTDDVPINL